jgi:hypothetical protein
MQHSQAKAAWDALSVSNREDGSEVRRCWRPAQGDLTDVREHVGIDEEVL